MFTVDVKQQHTSGDGPHKPLAFDQILVHLFLLFVFNLTNKILFKPTEHTSTVNSYGHIGGSFYLSTLFLAGLDLSGQPVLSAHTFPSN